jgi:type I restriction enzyme S subunit
MSGKYQAYPQYKDSGVDMLDDTPEHWRVLPLKYICELIDGDRSSVYPNESDLVDEGIPFFSSKNIIDFKLTRNNLNYITNEKFNALGRGKLVHDDLVITVRGTIGHVAVFDSAFIGCGTGFINAQMMILRPNNGLTRFLQKISESSVWSAQLSVSSYGSTVKQLSNEVLGNIVLALPPKQEVEIIANFLDQETAKIDTLIEKQQQLIKLLTEKRQAVISHAVTKGLNPNAPMRDSGVEWLGEVPEHWEISKFGYISMVVRGGSPRPAGDPVLFNGDYSPWVTVAEITKDDEIYLTQTDSFLTKKGSDQCRIFTSGTLLISNSGATLGVPKILNIDANANDGVVGFECLSLNHEFAYFYLSTLTEDLRERIKQGSGQPNLNTDIVKDISVPVPPENEVVEIVASIQNIRRIYAELMSNASKGIELLKERRTALISAAVTGKIDVRNWQSPEPLLSIKEIHTEEEAA